MSVADMIRDESRPLVAKVLCDSINSKKQRLTTLEVTMHRYVLAEFNTHRMFSRNAASSRAIPFTKRMRALDENPAIPFEFGKNQKGMQAFGLMSGEELERAKFLWTMAADAAIQHANQLYQHGVHKQVVNRIIEPYSLVTVVVSATEWDDFFWQRCHPDAQPEFQLPAYDVQLAMHRSQPVERTHGQWHLPFIADEDIIEAFAGEEKIHELYALIEERPMFEAVRGLGPQLAVLVAVSAARCSRVSYLTHEGKRDLREDVAHFVKLTSHRPMHASPLEHVAFASPGVSLGNFNGWHQLRKLVQQKTLKFFPNHPLIVGERA